MTNLKKITQTSLILFAIMLASCGEEKEFYKSSKTENTINAYETYIETYPEGKYIDEIKDSLNARLEDEAFMLTKEENYIYSYQNFLKEFRLSRYRKEANDSIYSLKAAQSFRWAKQKSKISAFQKVIDKYPVSRYAEIAKLMIDSLKLDKSGSFIDRRDGKSYDWVRIGDQVWMAENLASDYGYNSLVYDNDSANVEKYGCLYSYETAKKGCPQGWSLPSKNDFIELLNTIAEQKSDRFDRLSSREENGFRLVMAGMSTGSFFSGKDGIADFWTSTKKTGNFAWALHVNAEKKSVQLEGFNNKSFRYSVRCIKN